jgi:hypothetical protein
MSRRKFAVGNGYLEYTNLEGCFTVEVKSEANACVKSRSRDVQMRRATEVSKRFHAFPPRPNSLSEPENTRLSAQTVQLRPQSSNTLKTPSLTRSKQPSSNNY